MTDRQTTALVLDTRLEIIKPLHEIDPAWVLVQGDTNSVLASAIVTSKMDEKLGHSEAGLRSYDRTMPEEMTGF